MSINTSTAAKTMSELLGWNVTNLKLQKMLYIAHMFFIGRYDQKLINESFEAWDYGPVLPSLYKDLKFFGADLIMDVFPRVEIDKNSPEYKMLEEAASHLSSFTSGKLVGITHHKDGAWAKYYKPNIKNIKIPDTAIRAEYKGLYEKIQ